MIRNKDGIWINSNVFREEALHFEKHGYYCPDAVGSIGYQKYWLEQYRRCREGYEVGGAKITGSHYFYLNFTQIRLAKKKGQGRAKKMLLAPSFWDGDYNYFWAVEIARSGISKEDYNNLKLDIKIKEDCLGGGKHIIVGKARRKGYSYKNASIVANEYSTVPKSLSLICAYDSKYLYPNGTMGMVNNNLNFLNKHTAFGKNRHFHDTKDFVEASYKAYEKGAPVKKGYESQIQALTFRDNPDAARGKDANWVLWEEAGKFLGLKAAWMATQPALESGIYTTGTMIMFGTGGDMEAGTIDFSEMFYDPDTFNCIAFENIWDDEVPEGSRCSFFHPFYYNLDGYYDEQGNSDKKGAIEYEKDKRKQILKSSSDVNTLNMRRQEYAFSPSEAFLSVSNNDFPVVELQRQLTKVKAGKLDTIKGQPVTLEKIENKIIATPDLSGKLSPIREYKGQDKLDNKTGAVIIYEYPVDDPPRGLYKIGYDPYRQNISQGVSLGACYVYKSANDFSYTRDTIVASYIGRPPTSDDFNYQVELLAELYNAEVMHENEVVEVVSYFKRRRKLHLLASQPDAIINKIVNKSKVSRVYGIHMNEKIKDAGTKYIKQWLLEERDIDEEGKTYKNLDFIYDKGLLEELITYNPKKGNFDRIIAFMMILFQIKEESENKVYTKEEERDSIFKILDDTLFKR